MRRAVPGFLFALLLATPLAPSPVRAQDAERDRVVAVVERLFEGMRTRDTTMMRSTFAPGAHLYGVGQDGSLRGMSPDGFIGSIGGRQGPAVDERVFAPEVRIDGNLATVWTFYTLHVGEEFSHCGFDAFLLYRMADGWKIAAIGDTRRRENCEPPGG